MEIEKSKNIALCSRCEKEFEESSSPDLDLCWECYKVEYPNGHPFFDYEPTEKVFEDLGVSFNRWSESE